jgi:hypothetical protein
MNCETIKSLLHDYIDGTLTDQLVDRIDEHCIDCKDCLAELRALKQQKHIIASLPVTEADPAFSKRVFKNAVRDAGHGARPGYTPRFARIAAAAMLTAIALWFGIYEFEQQRDQESYVFMVGDDVRTVSVAIDSEQALDAVSMNVEISDNLELKGYGSKKSIQWTTRLQPGVNVISLPIVGLAQGDGEIKTRVLLNGKKKEMRIKTRYQKPGNVFINGDNRLG